MKTLEEIAELEQSGFGRPHPRHGLKLLYWFANKCLSFNQDNAMQSCCYPENGDFGFHTFENKYERNSGKLLPIVAFHYYEVGNLSKPRAYNLPPYVRKDFTRTVCNSNMDRIIVSLNNMCFERVYVTQHKGRSNFNKDFTYHISKRLIMSIRGLTLGEFLLQTGYSKQEPISFPTSLGKMSDLQFPCPAPPTISIRSPLQDICTNKDIHETESLSILKKNNTLGHHTAPSPTPVSISKDQDILIKVESPPILVRNDAEGHHKTPPANTICVSATTSSTNPDLHPESDPSSNLRKNNTQGHHTDSHFICSPAIPSSTNQDIQKEIKSALILMKACTQGHHKAPPTTPIHGDATPSSTNQDFHTEIKPPPISTNNNTQIHTIRGRHDLNDYFQDNTLRTFKISNVQTPAKDRLTSSTSTPTIVSSRNQNTDIKSSPISQMNRSFWGVYLFLIFSYFYFFWGNVMRISVILVSLLSFPWQILNRGEQGEKKGNMTTNSTEEEKQESGIKMHAVITGTQTDLTSRKQNTAIESSLVSQMNSFFWGFYLLFLLSFFYFFWGNVMRIFLIAVFYFAVFQKEPKGKRKETGIEMHAVTNNNQA